MVHPINKFKIMCPECGVAVVTANPKMLIWELCPSCRHHVWDMYDVLLAEVYINDRNSVAARAFHAEN
jgi:Zn-finger nucleic acid-binding protein